jgi:hypothetical protein
MAESSYQVEHRSWLLAKERAKGAQMTRIPDSLAIALWITGVSLLLALIAYVLDEREWIIPLVMLGILTGIAEWFMRRRSDD